MSIAWYMIQAPYIISIGSNLVSLWNQSISLWETTFTESRNSKQSTLNQSYIKQKKYVSGTLQQSHQNIISAKLLASSKEGENLITDDTTNWYPSTPSSQLKNSLSMLFLWKWIALPLVGMNLARFAKTSITTALFDHFGELNLGWLHFC